MFSINIRVACSVFVIFTVSLSANAFSASARAFFNALRMVTMLMTAPTRLPPNTMFNISLSSISIAVSCYVCCDSIAALLIDSYLLKPLLNVKARTRLRRNFPVTDDLHLRKTLVEILNIAL